MGILSATASMAAYSHAIAVYPQESCGVIVDGAYRPMDNVAEDPQRDFRIAARAYAAVAADVQAVLHSHPNGDPWPSVADMRSQVATAVPWGVFSTNGQTCTDIQMWGDGLPIPDLVGRVFVPGIADCFSLIRDYYRLHVGVTIPEVPRDHNWWRDGKDLYSEGLAANGFRVIPAPDVKPGDGFLCAIRSPVPNHGGVLWDDGLILHHLEGRLSRREPAGPWLRHITQWVRVNG